MEVALCPTLVLSDDLPHLRAHLKQKFVCVPQLSPSLQPLQEDALKTLWLNQLNAFLCSAEPGSDMGPKTHVVDFCPRCSE